MLKNIINEFRQANGQPALVINNGQENDHCLWHSKYMANTGCVHAPSYFLHDKAEAVAFRGFYRDYQEALRAIIFEDFAWSNKHRIILLFSDNLAAAFHVERNCVFVTIRGW